MLASKQLWMCSGLTPTWEVDGTNGPQEADATATPELEVPVPGAMQHFSSKEQEKVEIFLLSQHRTAEAAGGVRVMKRLHTPHFTTSGATIEERYRLCCHHIMLWVCFALCFLSGESLFSYFPVSHNLCNIYKCCLWSSFNNNHLKWYKTSHCSSQMQNGCNKP